MTWPISNLALPRTELIELAAKGNKNGLKFSNQE